MRPWRGIGCAGAAMAAALAAVLAAVPAAAQSVVLTSAADRGRLEATRGELSVLLAQYQIEAESSGMERRQRALDGVIGVRQRLAKGDFEVGDRIVLEIVGTPGTDTLAVEADGAIAVPGVARIPVSGLLRSELDQHVGKEIARYVRAPVTHAYALLRLSVEGAVGKPGYYLVTPSAPLADVIMGAGGPTQLARLDRLTVERGGRTLLDGEEVRAALDAGRSVDDLDLRAGDIVVVPQKRTNSLWADIGRYSLIVGSTVFVAWFSR